MSDDTDDKADRTEGVPLVIPQLGESVTEATMVEWMVRSGDHVLAEQPLVTLELDKVTVELAAPATGVFVMGARSAGDVVKVGEVVGTIAAGGPRDDDRERRHDELLAAIAAAPDDAGARQVYADFLLEEASPLRTWGAETTKLRGEYLALVERLQRPIVRADALDEGIDDAPTTTSMRARRDALEHVARTTALSLVDVTGELQVRDGFVADIVADLPTLEGRLARLMAQAPITQVAITGLVDHQLADRVLALPGLEQLHAVALRAANVGTAVPAGELARVVGSARLCALDRLALHGFSIGPEEGRAIAASRATTLELDDCELSIGGALGERAFDRLVIGLARTSADELRQAIARPVRTLRLVGPSPLPVIAPEAFARVEALELERVVVREPLLALGQTRLIRVALDRCTFVDPRGLYDWLHALPQQLARLEVRGTAVGDRQAAFYADEIRARTSAHVVL